jgi:hypothetical protein
MAPDTSDNNAEDQAIDTATIKPPQSAAEDESLQSKISGLMDEALKDEDEPASEDPLLDDSDDDEEPEEPGEDDEEPEEPEEEDDAASAEDNSSDDDEPHEGPSDAPALPEGHRRSLRAYGWEDEEIDQNLRALGDPFLRMAEKVHERRNTELEDLANRGQQARQQPAAGEQDSSASADSGQTVTAPSDGLQPINKDQLKEQYGDDELIDNLVDPINRTVETLNQVIPAVQKSQQTAEQQQLEKVQQQVDAFFGREDMKSYTDLYGQSSDSLNDQQVEARNRVLDTAYDLMVGAQQVRGRNLDMDTALEHAHEIVARDHKPQVEKQSIKKQAKKRQRGMTQKPTRKQGSGGTRDGSGRPESREELEKRTKQRMQKALSG